MMTFKEYLSLNNISLRRDENGNVGFLTHEATDGRTGELKTFHVLQGENSNGKFLFIPSLGAWDEHESGTRNLGDCEVVDNGINGYVVEEKNSKDLIEKIEMFLMKSVEERKAMGLAGRKKIEKSFNRKIVVEKYMGELV